MRGFVPLSLLIGACGSDPVPGAETASNDTSFATSSPETTADPAASDVSSRAAVTAGESMSLEGGPNTGTGVEFTSELSHDIDASADASSGWWASTSVLASGDAVSTNIATTEGQPSFDAGASDAGNPNSESRDASVETTRDMEPDSGVVTFPEGTPLVMLVIDASSGVFSTLLNGGSMGFGEYPDVWEAMRAVLSQLSGETGVRFWPVLYRAEQNGACPNLYSSEVEPVTNNAVLDGWLPPSADAVTENKQEGPLADALAVFTDKLLAYDHPGPKHMLFLGDGPPGDTCTFFDEPPCNRDPVFGIVQDMYRAGIRTRMLNLGEQAGIEFAEDVSHGGNGEPVISLQETAYCISMEAVRSGKIDSADYAAQEDYVVNWRDHASADYLPDGEVYSGVLSYSPSDAASLAEAVESYVQWVKEAP